ncbi:hypothetical protein [Embleya sp. NPDC005971]|uniref:hypothetical protein n=1 Tax=Embleya sp. NPDC005971 TaxID=3156724 RepID=UPI0034087973
MTEPTADPHRRRLDAIAGNAVGTALNAAPTPETGERWWFSLSLREHVGRAVVQALLDAGAIPPPPADLDEPRHTASDINDDQLAALYRALDETRQEAATVRAASEIYRTMHEQARDALNAHGRDDWPDIVAPIHALVDERDRLSARVAEYEAAIGFETTCLNCTRQTTAAYADTMRAERAEAAVQRVRDLHRPWTTVYGTHCNACSRLDITGTTMTGRVIDMPCPTIRALDAQPEPAADTDTAAPLTDHWPNTREQS